MRRLVRRTSIVLLAVALLATACSPSDNAAETTTTTTATGGTETTATTAATGTTGTTAGSSGSTTPETLNIHVAEFATLNPFLSSGIGRGTVTAIIYQPLVFLGPDNSVMGGAAKSWEISDDGLTITFHLRDDLTWSDGEPFTSADVLWSMSKYLTPSLSLWANRIGGVLGQGEGDVPSGLSAPDDYTFVVQLAGPNPAWLTILAAQGFVISMLPEHVLGTMSNDELASTEYFNDQPVTLGPYKFVQWQRDQYVELEKDPNWPQQPAFDKVRLSFLQSDVASAQLETGDLQLSAQIAPLEAERLKALDNVTVDSVPGVWPEVLQFTVDDPAISDPRVRQAMIYALDLDGLCNEVMAGFCKVTWNQVRLLAPQWAIPTDGLIQYEYNPDKAKELLAEAQADGKWDPNHRLTLINIGGQDRVRSTEAIVIQASFAAVGIGLDILSTDVGTLLDYARDPAKRPDWQMFINRGAHFAADPSQVSPYNSCNTFYPNGANISWYCRDDLDALWAEGLTKVTPEDRAPIYHQAFQILNHDPDVIDLYWPDTIVAHASQLQGLDPVGQPEHVTWNIADWTWGS